MKLAAFSSRIGEGVKRQVRGRETPFDVSVQSAGDAIRISGRAAFARLRMQAVRNGLSDMSLAEINQEIQKTRQGV